MTEPSSLVLATSAPSGRPEYRRDFLTCLAAPSGHEVSFLYKAHWWQPQLLAEIDKVIGRDAIIVFCERKASATEFEFLPLRHAVIRRVEPGGMIRDAKYSAATPVTITFRLGELVYATDSELPSLRQGWTTWLTECAHRPRPRAGDGGTEGRFIFDHSLFDDRDGADPFTSWSTLSGALAECGSLHGAYFFRVAAFSEQDSASAASIAPAAQGALPVVYSLATNRQYALTLDAYSTSGSAPFADVLDATTTSDKLTIQSTQSPSAGRSAQLLVILDAGAVSWPQIATIGLKGAKNHEHDVPRVDIVTRISPRSRDVVLLMLTLAVGAVLAGVSKDDFGLPLFAVYLLKVVGGLIVAVAGFKALRRAPGLGK